MSDDLDLFTGEIQRETYKRQKQERFEVKVLLQLLRGLEAYPGLAKKLRYRFEQEFGMIWFMQNCPEFPIRLKTYKSTKTIALPTLLKWPERTMVYKELDKVRENYEDPEGVGVVFASDGDELPEMVMHDMVHWHLAPEAKWRAEIKNGLVIETLDDFIQSVKFNNGWQLDGIE